MAHRNITADQLTFGIEIECTLPRDVIDREGISIGGHNSGPQLPGAPDGWQVMADCSINPTRSGHVGIEVVSPILAGQDGLLQVVKVLQLLNGWSVHVNRSTGLHIHIGTHGLGSDSLTRSPEFLRKVTALVARNETALFASTGTKSREHGTYSASMRPWLAGAIRTLTPGRDRFGHQDLGNRYQTLNLQALTRHGTIEFRVFQASTNVTKVATYIQTCLGLVVKAYSMKRRAKFNVDNADLQGTGGRIHQLTHDLCWLDYRGMSEKRHGRILTDDQIEDYRALGDTLGFSPTVAESVRELKRLGAKYVADIRSETGHRDHYPTR